MINDTNHKSIIDVCEIVTEVSLTIEKRDAVDESDDSSDSGNSSQTQSM